MFYMDTCDFYWGTSWVYLNMYIMSLKTIQFWNKGVVQADPPSCGKRQQQKNGTLP